jgi:hypothetical protein
LLSPQFCVPKTYQTFIFLTKGETVKRLINRDGGVVNRDDD